MTWLGDSIVLCVIISTGYRFNNLIAGGTVVNQQSSSDSHNPRQGTLTVRAMVIRDGTPGISLSMGTELIGEWTDSRARTLSLTDDHKVSILGAGGEHLYLLSAPGKALSGEVVSDTEVAITFEM